MMRIPQAPNDEDGGDVHVRVHVRAHVHVRVHVHGQDDGQSPANVQTEVVGRIHRSWHRPEVVGSIHWSGRHPAVVGSIHWSRHRPGAVGSIHPHWDQREAAVVRKVHLEPADQDTAGHHQRARPALTAAREYATDCNSFLLARVSKQRTRLPVLKNAARTKYLYRYVTEAR